MVGLVILLVILGLVLGFLKDKMEPRILWLVVIVISVLCVILLLQLLGVDIWSWPGIRHRG